MQVHIVQVIVVCKLVTGNTQYDLGFFLNSVYNFLNLNYNIVLIMHFLHVCIVSKGETLASVLISILPCFLSGLSFNNRNLAYYIKDMIICLTIIDILCLNYTYFIDQICQKEETHVLKTKIVLSFIHKLYIVYYTYRRTDHYNFGTSDTEIK